MRLTALLMALLGLGTPSVLAAPALRLSGAQVAQLLEQALSGLVLHLDYDVQTASRGRVERSFLQLPETLGARRVTFSVPEQRVDLGGVGRITYRVRDINLEKVSVVAEEKEYVLKMFFEGEGYELVAAERAAPDVQMDRMQIELRLRPKQGSSELEQGKIRFDANIAPGVLESSVPGASALLDNLTGYKQRFKKLVEDELTRVLANPELWQALNGQLKGRGRFEGTELVVRVQ